MSLKSLVRSPQCPPSTPMNDPPSLYTSIRYINMKLLGFYPWCQTGSFDINDDPKKIIHDIEDDPVLLTQVRNPHCFQSTGIKDPPSSHTSN